MLVELALSAINERRLGPLAEPLQRGKPSRLFRGAKLAVTAGLGLRLLRRRLGPARPPRRERALHGPGLAFRLAWVEAGKASAADAEAVARAARQPNDKR